MYFSGWHPLLTSDKPVNGWHPLLTSDKPVNEWHPLLASDKPVTVGAAEKSTFQKQPCVSTGVTCSFLN